MRDKILDKATQLFLSLGFKSVTMDDLANEMGMSKKTIYSHFQNKTKLVEACTSNLFTFISSGVQNICSLKKNPIEEIYEIKRFMMLHLKNDKSSPQHQLQKYYPKIWQSLKKKQFEVMLSCVVNNLERGVAQGIYRSNINVEFIARVHIYGSMTIKDSTLFPPELFPMETLKDHYLEYHIQGIVNEEGRKILNEIINSNEA